MNILFLSVSNSVRSQMAEGIARNLLGSKAKIQSAGSNPAKIHPTAIRVMDEIEIDISKQRSKSIGDIDLFRVDLVITLCDEEICPVTPISIKKMHWPIPDPVKSNEEEGDRLNRFRMARNQIKMFLFDHKFYGI